MKNDEKASAEEALCREVQAELTQLMERRKQRERGWELNMNFVNGNQYVTLSGSGEIAPVEKTYDWEQRRVFNHIASVVDIRLSKLSRIRPALSVRAATDGEDDRKAAELASAILSSVQEECDLDGVISSATMWSEICGTAFYKIVWSGKAGKKLGETEDGERIYEGGVRIVSVSPFEIYPFAEDCENIEDQPGIIQAKLLTVNKINEMYGVKTAGKKLSEFNLPYGAAVARGIDGEENYALVTERYLKEDGKNPEGRLTVTAGEILLYDGPLPYLNGADGRRGYPFVKQVSMPVAGSFFGASVVDRLIPVQRAYNAVKNRKHEYLNRISMGAVAVEEGSVDVDELADDGLAPGKILVYRQGGNPPEMLSLGNVPEEFWKEEESLLTEFTKISGTGELSENADGYAGVTSATGLQLIIDQDDARLNVAYGSLKRAMREIGRQILRLYRQFATEMRLLGYSSKDRRGAVCFMGGDIAGDDVILEADTDLNLTPAQRRTLIFELMDRGLFSDENGRIPVNVKRKILNMIGYASLAEALPTDGKGENNG